MQVISKVVSDQKSLRHVQQRRRQFIEFCEHDFFCALSLFRLQF
jgi:hypothetical protein